LDNALSLSPVIAGCMKWGQWGAKFPTAAYLDMIHSCLDEGVTTFDHADIYGHYTTEEEFGQALALEPGLRERMQLITKCGIRMVTPHRPSHQIKSYDTSAEHIRASVDRSLKNLRTDRIDLLLIHRPDPLMDPVEIAEVVRLLKQEGKVLHFGVSNFTPSQVMLQHRHLSVEYHQFEVSVSHRLAFTDGTLDLCQVEGIRPQSWSPLGGGKLTADAEDESSRKIVAAAEILGRKHGIAFDQVLLAWLMQHPAGITPVLGTTKIERVRKAMQALEVRMEREEWFMLLRAATGHEVA
jgi:predicted oxidoreductase